MSHSSKVAIIGAGFAGLRCADILVQNGVQVTIFEARDRVGGRVCLQPSDGPPRSDTDVKQVHQTNIGGHLVDLGPNWIHGTDKNPIAGVAELTETTIEDIEGQQIIFSRKGELIDEAVSTKISEFLWTTIDEAFQYSNKNKDVIPPDESLLDFFKKKIEQTDFTAQEKELCIESCRLWGAYVGDSIERQSLKFFCLEECIDGNNFFVASTYNKILAHVSKAAIQHADIRFKQPIVRIETQNPKDSSASRTVALTTAAGETHHFDDVVVTCPLGWLKRNKSAFHPQLPLRLAQAINSISYGRLEKVYVTFPRAFWHIDAKDGLTGPSTASNPPGAKNPVFAQFLNPTYAEHPTDIPWNQECLSFAGLPGPCAQPTLLFYTYGPCATHIVSHIANLHPSSEDYYAFLDDFLRPFYSRLRGYSSSSADCKPLAFVATQWQNDAYAGNGSYSNFQIGLAHGDRDVEALRGEIGPERGVWFAGEHTAPFVALGTTTGAYWSGERAAGQICRFRGLESVGVTAGRDDSLPSAGERTSGLA
ncbi:flavin monoamine oxidase family protein [Aspergillus clavatus NRRL 1]|uniref:Flavin containing amine oxidase, putative n=1 Tax=Aspergillus clavatus (strain ATCC 1007 / CBS 513.65 / DSM 816 / NCTC 3887 / NRRL 1 / QM 1276 / 107) TaxID=344612 RepID=A1CKW1_ASPCL|nr:flavin containing amine oxidase, putative [Aspergillus clavatus NRRL 1]EAW09785.1 flavin containing amine oxidase, putative [Aspergillus clavatus NRRL 1]